MSNDEHMMEIFMKLHEGLPRQGPGSDDMTRRALAEIKPNLPAQPQVLDVGCGPGKQTLVLAQALDGHVTAVDVFPVFLDQLNASASAAGLADRITTRVADMTDMPFDAQQFDVIWAEGSAYIMGIGNALQNWAKFLKPSGYLVFSHLVWLQDEPPAEAVQFWDEEYPDITDIASNISVITSSGYRVLTHFTLPDAAWWDEYYTPLSAKHPVMREHYAADTEAQAVLDMSAREIAVRRKFAATYGYEFFITQLA